MKNSQKSQTVEREEQMLEFWKDRNIFKKSLEKPSPKGEFIFYEGPPTANGKPGIHHLAARAFKDAIPRYKTMQGYYVRRKAGWDTHGLPVELEVEKALGFKSKHDIEKFGIAEFNKKCRESVWKYLDEWRKFTERTGFWVDQDDEYITYDPTYIESIWHILSKAHQRELLYKDYKVVPWCPRCGTALSSHELAQGYKDVKDLSVTAKFKVTNPEKIGLSGDVYLLAWTTTPWTLPGNVGLAVGEDIDYILVRNNSNLERGIEDGQLFLEEGWYVLAESAYKRITKEGNYFSDEIKSLKGVDLLNLAYEPLYPYLQDVITDTERPKLENAYKVYPADFVNTEEGTGIVHTAVMYGQDDFELGSTVGLPKHHLVDEGGKFVVGTDFLEGKFVRDDSTAVDIIKDLAHRGLLFNKSKHEHSYPHCWRCKTALIYYARDSWYIAMSKLRAELVSENQKINWIPAHIRDGRFGEWLKDVKDWAISRARYWGTPLPIWLSEDGSQKLVIGSMEELQKYTKKSGNQYFVMRHGEADNNVLRIVSSEPQNPHHLTEQGERQTREAVRSIKDKNIDLIFTSPFVRTKETAQIVSDELGLSKNALIEDERIREVKAGNFDGKPIDEYHEYFHSLRERFEKSIPDHEHGEDYGQLKQRMGRFIYDLESKYTNKNILIVTHDAPAWLLFSASAGYNIDRAVAVHEGQEGFIGNAEVRPLPFVPIPHNENFELDLHRPYIDGVVLEKEGQELSRTPEVLDVWFDSGAMPFAQDHYPFENKEYIEGHGYPADYIAEAIDQTRGWFYTLHAIGAIMERGHAYKNVVSLGHLLDKEGKKMSKSVGNVVDPWEMMDKYGADALRLWMYGVNQPGDSKNFDERSVEELIKKIFNLLDNILRFYKLYATNPMTVPKIEEATHTLDLWILSRLDQSILECTNSLDKFDLNEPVRILRDLTADFSQWYIRRSRERFKSSNQSDASMALAVTRHVLIQIAKLFAPLAPFFAEQLFQEMRNEDNAESVHLEAWPKPRDLSEAEMSLLSNMSAIRRICSLGLEAREKAGIKVRQPLSSVLIQNTKYKIQDMTDLLQLIKDELNIKDITFDDSIENEIELDTNITDELKHEGYGRELLRAVQDMRKEAGLAPGDTACLMYYAEGQAGKIVQSAGASLRSTAFVELEQKNTAPEGGKSVEIDDCRIVLKLL